MEEFAVITMIASNGVKLYFGATDDGNFKWTQKKYDGIWFSEESKAIEFASNYFKKFNDWKIESVSIKF